MARPELEALAHWVASVDVDVEDARLRERLFATMLDWSTALVAGIGHPLFEPYKHALTTPGEVGQASLAGLPIKQPAVAAMAFNAAVSHFHEVDDAHRTSTSHPGITVIPVVMTLAELERLDARTVASAIVAGFETIIRVGSHLGAGHYEVSHTTATAGSFGAAAAAARALGLNAQQTLWALGHAGTQASGLWQFLDDKATAAKAFHVATAVRNGLAAARMAQVGIAGAEHILEGPRGMRRAWRLEGCDVAWLTPGDTPMIHDVTIKGWPVCGQMHSALDCAQALYERDPARCRQVKRVRVELPASALAIAGITEPESLAEAKFSTAFCISAMLCGRAPDFLGFSQELLEDPTIRRFMRRVEVVESAEFSARFPRERPARVKLESDEGETVVEERSLRRGDPEAPWSRAELEARAAGVLSLSACAIDTAGLVNWCEALAAQSDRWSAQALFAMIPHVAGEERS
ncbi:MmgE/PrpD family protein [Halomonas sp. HP20-15]|uniref:MmgE/PrpD family protein n=1 Tax=Halomonas sp. HP20-15 TaxID=3085901 RepID=UPI00298183D7|nr:MmgE/PrpD family protein [Halomonas sp. HP20-15]MDW5375759.1 MmgE/PrpD family protein [Halomonas sp. HP20-15]